MKTTTQLEIAIKQARKHLARENSEDKKKSSVQRLRTNSWGPQMRV